MKSKRRITIRDVAAECGLALSTVSNALAGRAHVKEETRAQVREVAERLGYRASALARALRTQRSSFLGVLVPDIANPVIADFIRGIEDVASRDDYTILLSNTDGSEASQLRQIRFLLDRQVDGLILISQHCESYEIRSSLDAGLPFVLIQRRSQLFRDDYVGANNQGGVELGLRYLHSLGHRRIGFVRGPADSSTALERLESFEDAVHTFGLDADPDLLFAGDYSTDSGYRAMLHFNSLNPRPTAVFASNDVNALGLLDAADELGIKVPEHVSVLGWDDIAMAGLRRIALTTVHLPKREMGQAAAELLIKRIRSSRPASPREIIFNTHLVERASCAAPGNGI